MEKEAKQEKNRCRALLNGAGVKTEHRGSTRLDFTRVLYTRCGQRFRRATQRGSGRDPAEGIRDEVPECGLFSSE